MSGRLHLYRLLASALNFKPMSLRGLLKFVGRYWNAAVALLALAAVVLYTVIPGAEKHINAVLFICATAVTLMMIDIRAELDPDRHRPKGESYESLHAAREQILERMCDVLKAKGTESTEILILGGRIRTITDLIRHLVADLNHGSVHGKNVSLRVLAISPSFTRNLRLPGSVDATDQARKNASYATMIEASADELVSLSNEQVLKDQNIQISVGYYDFLPHYYCFLIGQRCLFWGFYTWDRRSSDISGPENRCFFLDHRHPDFESYLQWFTNRFELIGATAQAESSSHTA